ncbi:oleosin Ara h 10.0102-like [Bidens hawaiensis]|uniref:oleosin Ara h 10.0102-like n=1 Tax=Bidens hawaiensis TaxID=980011 RepID=UPI00404B7EBC
MATYERDRQPQQIQVHTIHDQRFDQSGINRPYYSHQHQQGPSKSKVLAVVAILPVGLTLLGLAGLTLAGTLIGLAVVTPLFVIFSPILVPAVLAIGLAVAGFLTSGTFGLTGLSSLSFLVNILRQITGSVPEQVDSAKRRLQDLVEYTGQKTKDVGQTIQDKAHDIGESQVHVGGQIHAGGQAHAGGAKEGRGASKA